MHCARNTILPFVFFDGDGTSAKGKPLTILTIDALIGTWRLLSSSAVSAAGRAIPDPWGPEPMGRLALEASGRMMAVLCDGRTEVPEGEARSYSSYCGNFIFTDDKIHTTVDAASDPSRIGSVQVRGVEFRGEHLVLTPPPRTDGERRELTWARVSKR